YHYDHESIYDGCVLSGTTWMRFNHNDMNELEKLLKKNFKKYNRIIVIVDAVYSMDGDVAPMPEIVKLAKKYNAMTMVDEAHAIGVIGEKGKGIQEYFGLKSDDIDVYMGTLSKAIPSIGGYIAGKKDLITYLKYSAHPFIFSAALPPPCLASASKAIDIIIRDGKRRQRLRQNIHYFLEGIQSLGFDTLKSKDTAIIPVVIGDDKKTFEFAKIANQMGVFVCPIVYPAVPRNKGRLRCCVMANHTKQDLDTIFNVFWKVGKKLKLI
ncbi:aminotransferase class I/II-fold pyridoxal phosphate-dependent enzyme, partial [Nanoarchaeota archaeon]